MPNNLQFRNSRSGKSRSSNLQLKLPVPVPVSVNNFFEVSGQAFAELSGVQKHAKMTGSLKLPVLPETVASRTSVILGPPEIKSPLLTCGTEWKVPMNCESIKSETNSQPSFIRSVSASESESWSDDLDIEMTAQLKANLTRVDDMFYSSLPVTNNQELFQEIKLWQNRFPFLRVIGKKAKIFPSNSIVGSDISAEKEEVILNDSKFNESDDNHWSKLSSYEADSDINSQLKKRIRNSVIEHLTTHFILAMKEKVQECSPPSAAKPLKKPTRAATCHISEALDINENRLRVHDFDDILNISPIRLKITAPKSNYLSSFSAKSVGTVTTKTYVSKSTHLRIEHKLSTKIFQPVDHSPRYTTDDVSVIVLAGQHKNSQSTNDPFALSLRKNKIKLSKNVQSLTSNVSHLSTLPPLKKPGPSPGLSPTSAVYSSFKRLPSESRPTSSFSGVHAAEK